MRTDEPPPGRGGGGTRSDIALGHKDSDARRGFPRHHHVESWDVVEQRARPVPSPRYSPNDRRKRMRIERSESFSDDMLSRCDRRAPGFALSLAFPESLVHVDSVVRAAPISHHEPVHRMSKHQHRIESKRV